jgi:hypothetical protein
MRFALNSLAVVAPEWLLSWSDAEWIERYGHRIEESRLDWEHRMAVMRKTLTVVTHLLMYEEEDYDPCNVSAGTLGS